MLTANFASEEILRANALVEESDIVAVLTPIYKAYYTGILKTYLDLLSQKALVDKRIVPIAIGGLFGHLLAIEYALKPVLSVLGATEILNTVYFLDRQIERLEADGYRIDEEAEQRLNVELLKLAPAKIIN